MPIDMIGHVDGVLESIEAHRRVMRGDWGANGLWVEDWGPWEPYTVNIQPASDREVEFLRNGGERILDARRVYVNDGEMEVITLEGEWLFLGVRWKTVKCDNRYWNSYCKLIVTRLDDQERKP